METTGFVKLPRSLLNEEWAKNPATLSVFIHLLISANYEEKAWRGINIPRGGVVISQRSLAKECGITPRAVRTALQTLCAHNIAHTIAHTTRQPRAQPRAHSCTVVTLCKYDTYGGKSEAQRAPQRAPGSAGNAHPSAQNAALPKEIDREYNKEIYKEIFGEDSCFLPILEEWITYKKEMGRPYKGRKGITQFCRRLKDLSKGNPEAAKQLVNVAMASNWSTIFPPKGAALPARASNTNPRIMIDGITPEDEKSTI